MPFKLIKGTFHVEGYSPDGDSIKFKADNDKKWKLVKGKKISPDKRGNVQLRVEAIDSLETHYKGAQQPKKFGEVAGDALMMFLGISSVKWGPTRKYVTSAKDGVKGFILTRETGPYGRPIAFLFAGIDPRADGSDVYLDVKELKKSANYHMLQTGLAYPLFYETLFFDLRDELSKVVVKARSAKKGVWSVDESRTGFKISDVKALQQSVPILPKLFRRIIEMEKNGAPWSDFGKVLSSERVTILPKVQHTDLDEAVEVKSGKARLLHDPENLIVGTVIR